MRTLERSLLELLEYFTGVTPSLYTRCDACLLIYSVDDDDDNDDDDDDEDDDDDDDGNDDNDDDDDDEDLFLLSGRW